HRVARCHPQDVPRARELLLLPGRPLRRRRDRGRPAGRLPRRDDHELRACPPGRPVHARAGADQRLGRGQGLRGQADGALLLNRRRWIVAGAGAAVVVLILVGAGLGYYFYEQHQARDIRGSSTIEFVPTETAPTPPPKPRPKPGKPAALTRVDW